MKTIYSLVHKDTQERCFRTYTSIGGARIAQRLRNRKLGFLTRIERLEDEDCVEIERCINSEGDIEDATYTIHTVLVEDDEFERLYSSE